MNPSQNPSALRSRKMITETMLELLKQFPLHDITVKQILIETGLSRKTFYRHFTSKEDVLSAYIDAILNDYKEAVLGLPEISFLNCFDIIFQFCTDHTELLLILKENGLLNLPLVKLNAFLPTLNPTHPLWDYVIYFRVGGIWNLITNWLENGRIYPIEEIKQTLLGYLTHIDGITAPRLSLPKE